MFGKTTTATAPATRPVSVFGDKSDLFTRYSVQITMLDKLLGGSPKDPNIMMAHIRTSSGATTNEEEMRIRLLAALEGMGYDRGDLEGESLANIIKASQALVGEKGKCGFKKDVNGIYIESRHIKAMLRESVNIVLQDRPVTMRTSKIKDADGNAKIVTKNAKSVFVERVFVDTYKIYLNRQEPDGEEFWVGHPIDPKTGERRSNLSYFDYVDNAVIDFEMSVMRDYMSEQDWAEVWLEAEKNGLGAVRSQDFGHFVVTRWEKIKD